MTLELEYELTGWTDDGFEIESSPQTAKAFSYNASREQVVEFLSEYPDDRFVVIARGLK